MNENDITMIDILTNKEAESNKENERNQDNKLEELETTIEMLKNVASTVTFMNQANEFEVFLRTMVLKGDTVIPPNEDTLSLDTRDFNGWTLQNVKKILNIKIVRV